MPWRAAAVLELDDNGGIRDANEVALDLLGVDTITELLALPPGAFQPEPPDPENEAAFRAAFLDAVFRGLLAEGAIRRLDGELVRVRTAILPVESGGFRALLYPVERPTTDLSSRIFKIADVLEEWRAAERRLVEVDPATTEGSRLAADVELLKSQYQTMFSRRHEAG